MVGKLRALTIDDSMSARRADSSDKPRGSQNCDLVMNGIVPFMAVYNTSFKNVKL